MTLTEILEKLIEEGELTLKTSSPSDAAILKKRLIGFKHQYFKKHPELREVLGNPVLRFKPLPDNAMRVALFSKTEPDLPVEVIPNEETN